MNTHEPPATGDDTLDGDERAVAAIYARLGAAEPDAALDAAIRTRARAAVSPRHRMRPWAVGLSSAAVLVLAAGLAWRNGTSLQHDAPTMQAPPAPAATDAAPESAPARPTQNLSPPSASPPPAALRRHPPPPTVAPKVLHPEPAPPPPRARVEAISPRTMHEVRPPASEAAAVRGDAEAARQAMAPEDPAARIERIRRLLRDDHREAAVEALRALRRDHPDYPLPDDLAALSPR